MPLDNMEQAWRDMEGSSISVGPTKDGGDRIQLNYPVQLYRYVLGIFARRCCMGAEIRWYEHGQSGASFWREFHPHKYETTEAMHADMREYVAVLRKRTEDKHEQKAAANRKRMNILREPEGNAARAPGE